MGIGENTGENTGSSTASSGSSLARPTAPTIVSFGSATTSTLTLTWTYNDSYTMDATYVYLLQGGVQQGVYTKLGTATSHTFTGLSHSTLYQAYVITENGERLSDASITASANTSVDAGSFTPEYTATFESGTLGDLAQGTNALSYADSLSVYDNTYVDTGDLSCRIGIIGGTTGSGDYGGSFGGSAGTTPYPIPYNKSFWYKVRLYIPTTWSWLPAGSKGPWRHRIRTTGGVSQGFADVIQEESRQQIFIEPGFSLSYPAPLPKGQWVTLESQLKLHTTDGIYRVWQDGVLIHDYSGQTTYSSDYQIDATLVFNFFDGLDVGGAPQSQNLWMDNIVICTDDNLPPNTDADGNAMIGSWVPPVIPNPGDFTPEFRRTFEGTAGELAIISQNPSATDGFDSGVSSANVQPVFDNTVAYTGTTSARLEVQEFPVDPIDGIKVKVSQDGQRGYEKYFSWGGNFGSTWQLYSGRELWVRASLWVPADFDFGHDQIWDWSRNGGDGGYIGAGASLKFIRLGTKGAAGNTNGWQYHLAYGNGEAGGAGAALAVEGVQESIAPDFYSRHPYNPSCSCNKDYNCLAGLHLPCSTLGNIPREQWVDFEIYTRFSDSNQSIVRLWQDSVLVFEEEGYQNIPTGNYFHQIRIFTYWNAGAPKTQHLYIGDITATTDVSPPTNIDAYGNLLIGDWNG